jgi:soluble lytic murein transglycosylase
MKDSLLITMRPTLKALLTAAIVLCLFTGTAWSKMPQWSDIGREISLGLYLAAKEDAKKIETSTPYERARKALVLALIDKRLGEKRWPRYLQGIPASSPYRQPADLLLEEQLIVPESIQGRVRPISPFMKKFYSLWRIDKIRALRFLSWAPDVPENRRAVQIAFNRLFYEGEDEILIGSYQIFRSLHRPLSNRIKLALAHWREGDLQKALRVLNQSLKKSPNNKVLLFWKGLILHRLGRLNEAVWSLRRVNKGLSNGFYPWYSRMMLGLIEYRGSPCRGEKTYPDPLLYALAESGLVELGQKMLKEGVLNSEHPDLVSASQLYPYQSMRLSYLQRENGDTCLRYPTPWRRLVEDFGELYGVPEEMLYALVKTESSFNRRTISYSNARGLTQVLPSTERWILQQKGGSFSNCNSKAFLPFFSLQLGGWYLLYLNTKFNNSWPLVVASYNGGPGRTKRWLKQNPYPSLAEVAAFYPLNQTRRYVKKFFVYQLRYLGASVRSE